MNKKYLKTAKDSYSCMISKKAMSDVLATVLITTITILALAIVSLFVFNLINDDTINLSDLDLKITRVEASYNNQPTVSNILNANELKETVYVSVERGTDKSTLTGLNFIFSIDGNSYECLRRAVPSSLETSVYAFKSSIFYKKPDKVTVVPIVYVGNSERIARSGFDATISDTMKEFEEDKVDECGGFCCGANDDLPPNPGVPVK